MSLSQVLRAVLARKWIVLLTLLVTVVATLVTTLSLNKEYTATTTVIVDFKGLDPVMGAILPPQLMPGYIATQVDIIQSQRVAVEVVRKLRLAENPAARQAWTEATEGKGSLEGWYADLLLKKLSVRPSRESNVMSISFSGSDPKFAAIVADTFAEMYQKTNLELRVEPARQSAAWFDERLRQLRKNLEEAQSRLNAYQREKGFTAQDERLDLESARLGELSAQYTVAQAQAADAVSRQRQLSEFVARGASPESLPDVLGNALVQNLKSQLTLTEARLQQASSQLGKNHPEVRRLEADIEGQKAKLKAEIANVAAGVNNSARIAQKREADLAAQLAAQKARVLRVNQGRDESAVLIKEVESAQRAYEAASLRFQQTSLESQASQTNISVLNKALVPIEPSFPILWLNMALSVFLGTGLGLALALVVESMSNRVRAPADLSSALDVAVLGVIPSGHARSGKGALLFWRRKPRTAPPPPQLRTA